MTGNREALDPARRICRRYFSGMAMRCHRHNTDLARCEDWEAGRLAASAGGGMDTGSLAEALLTSGWVTRYSDYAHRAYPDTMAREDPAVIAKTWAEDIAAALSQQSEKP